MPLTERPSSDHEAANPDAGSRAEGVRALASRLDRIASTARAMLTIRMAAWLLSALIGLAVLGGSIDLILRLPSAVRIIALIAVTALLVVALRRLLIPIFGLRLRRTDLALRVESVDAGRRGVIAPAIDLLEQTESNRDDPISNAISIAAIRTANERLRGVHPWKIVRWSALRSSIVVLVLLVALVGTLSMWQPALTSIGAQRVLTPWTDANWPKRFAVEDLTEAEVHPIDEAIALRALVGPADPGSRVRVEWSVTGTPVSRTPMAAQPGAIDGQRVFERLIDPSGASDDAARLQYRFISPDDRTEWVTVRLVRPPELVEAIAEVTAPEHALNAPGLTAFRTGSFQLENADAALGPIVEGSEIVVTYRFSKPVSAVAPMEWVNAGVASLNSDNAPSVNIGQPDAQTLVLRTRITGPVRVIPMVQDEFGLSVRGSISLSIDGRRDAVPGIEIVQPSSDEVVTPNATIPVRATASDDLGITRLILESQLARPPGGSQGAAPDPVGDPVVLAGGDAPSPQMRGEVESILRPLTLGALPGDEIRVAAIARDTRGSEGETRSSVRRLRVVSASDLSERLRAEFAPIGRALRRADDRQETLIARTRAQTPEDESLQNELVREQITLGDAISTVIEAARSVDRSRSRNQLDDPSLESLLQELDSTLNDAEDAARTAATALDADQQAKASRAQQETRDRLGEAMALLDRGEDAFLARRAVSRLRDQLAESQRQTGKIGAETAGRDTENLTDEQRAELDALAREQEELADAARDALEELTLRAESLDRDDPAQAEALRRAAEQGRAGNVSSTIEQASAETQSNQTSQSQQTQQEALDQLEQMLEEIDSAAGLRDTALRRKLATLIESITTLIESQARELEAIARVRNGEPDAGLAAGMISLRENTLGVIHDASAALVELRLIAESLKVAESEQATAAVLLRDIPPQLEQAERAEIASLAALQQALDEAKKQDELAEDREQQRKKAALKRAYQEALETQSEIRDESAPLIGRTLNRRERGGARRLAARQRELADVLDGIREDTDELADAPVFALAHDRLDQLTRAAAEGLGDAAPHAGIGLDQAESVRLLASLVDVLGDPKSDQPEDFQEGSDGSGGQGGGEQQDEMFPPVAELRLLRAMQQAAMETTRVLDETADLRDASRVTDLAGLQRLLAERGMALIEKMQQQQGAGAVPPPSEQPGGSDGSPVETELPPETADEDSP